MILVVSEVIKELPASLILRPFNFDTLAVSTYIYAAEERMFDAAAPSIAIVAVGLLPIFVLSRLIVKSRPGYSCLLYTSPSPRDRTRSRMPSSA